MKTKLLIIVILIAFTSCTKKPGSLTGNVFWKYNDYVGNKPDAGSDVKLYSLTNKETNFKTTSDVSGNYKIEEITPGKYFLIVQSNNTTDSPQVLVSTILNNSSSLNFLFGFDEKKYSKEINEIKSLQEAYEQTLIDNDQKYGGLENKIEKYEAIEKDINTKCMFLIAKFPTEFTSKIGIASGYNEKSIDLNVIEISEGKTTNQNKDFGITYY